MWTAVLLMALVSGIDPGEVAAVAYMLSRERPMGLLAAYVVGGFGVSLLIGSAIVFVANGRGVGSGSSIPPTIEIGVGILALAVAGIVGSGLANRLRLRRRSRRPRVVRSPRVGPGRLPGFDLLPARAQSALLSDSPWIAWAVGLLSGLPAAYYLAAIAAIVRSGDDGATQMAALVVFNIVSFATAAVPLAAFAVAPDTTRRRIDGLHQFVRAHQQLAVAVIAGFVGTYLTVAGIGKL